MRTERDINLIPARPGRFINGRLTVIAPGIAVAVVALTFFAFFMPYLKIKSLHQEDEKLKQEILSSGYINDLISRYENVQKTLLERKSALAAVQEEKLKVLDFLEGLRQYLPENIYITNIKVNKDNIYNISFVSKGPVDTARLLVKLREIFENPEINNISVSDNEIVFALTLRPKVLQKQASSGTAQTTTAKAPATYQDTVSAVAGSVQDGQDAIEPEGIKGIGMK